MNRSHVPHVVTAILAALTLTGCRFPRDDDRFEPNNTPATATPLVFATAVSARANENDPDVFRVDVEAAGSLLLVIEHQAYEELPSFTLTGPDGDDVYRDGPFISHRPPRPELCAPGVTMIEADGTYALRAEDAAPGAWYLTILEMGAADNAFLFSWDYRLTATLQ